MIRVVLSVLLALVVLVGAAVGALVLYSKNYTVPESPATVKNDTGLVQTSGRAMRPNCCCRRGG